jgi:hypothetical protein
VDSKYTEAYYFLKAGINDAIKSLKKTSLPHRNKAMTGEIDDVILMLQKRLREAEDFFLKEKNYERMYNEILQDINDATDLIYEIANEKPDKKLDVRIRKVYPRLLRYGAYKEEE